MRNASYMWRAGGIEHELELVRVPGTGGTPYLFGAAPGRPIEIRDFHISSTPVTQALWNHVMGASLGAPQASRRPASPSWDEITGVGGFLERINSSGILAAVSIDNAENASWRFRLPSETEWEYAARGGPHWIDGFTFSGSNDINAVAWYGRKFSRTRRLICRLLGWRLGWHLTSRIGKARDTHVHDVALKMPNQLGLYDMCGNVWEWCEDACVHDLDAVPRDGSPLETPAAERRVRGGCHHNWDIHCTVAFRYEIASNARDGSVGFRLVLAPA